MEEQIKVFDDTEVKLNKLGFTFVHKKNKYYTNTNEEINCSHGHSFIARPKDIFHRNKDFFDNTLKLNNKIIKGCMQCHNLKLHAESVNLAQTNLPKDYKIIDTYRENVDRKSKKSKLMFSILCNKGHTYVQESGYFKTSNFCPQCSQNINLGEERTRVILEEILKTQFRRIRPNFMKNPETNSNLELDGYSEDLRMAFEFQGRQHYDENTKFGDLDGVQKRDKIKKRTII